MRPTTLYVQPVKCVIVKFAPVFAFLWTAV